MRSLKRIKRNGDVIFLRLCGDTQTHLQAHRRAHIQLNRHTEHEPNSFLRCSWHGEILFARCSLHGENRLSSSSWEHNVEFIVRSQCRVHREIKMSSSSWEQNVEFVGENTMSSSSWGRDELDIFSGVAEWGRYFFLMRGMVKKWKSLRLHDPGILE